MNTIEIVLIMMVVVLCVLVFLVAPSRGCKASRQVFWHRNIAHRGLHTKDESIPENSMAAFKAAVDAGYGIELDLQFSKDEQIVIFHDDVLDRICGVEGRVDEYTYDELQQFSLCGTEEKIPLFSDFLKMVNGQVPLLVELKNGPKNKKLCEKAAELLENYKGEYCVESFNPFIIAWFKKHAPEVMRGVLAGKSKGYKGIVKFPTAIVLSNCLLNFLARPHFISYHYIKNSVLIKLADKLGAMRFVWTVHPKNEIKKLENVNDAVIFEYYLPPTKF